MRAALLPVMLSLSGFALASCAMPPVLVVASYSADVVSYAATGKTVTDHAYSAIARSDCSFVRVLREKPICVDELAPNAAVAQAQPQPPAAPPVAPARDTYVTIGSFHDQANAERAAAHCAPYRAVLVAVTVHGEPFHRVVAGPLTHDEAAALKGGLVASAADPKRLRG